MTENRDMPQAEDPQALSAISIEVTESVRSRGRDGVDRLVPALYDELRRLATMNLRRIRRAAAADATLATTALVNEAYLRLVDQSNAQWNDRAHFLALAAVAMRHVLIDRARARSRQKRGGGVVDVTFQSDAIQYDAAPQRLLEINDALNRLAQLDPRLARVVEYRFFGGLSDDEIALALSVTVRTVQRDWQKARTLLRSLLAE